MNICYKDYTAGIKPVRAWVEMGDRGPDVKELQKKLNQIGYTLAVDGIFGKATDEAVRQFQTSVGISVDGQAGKNTMAKLQETIANACRNTILGSGACRMNLIGCIMPAWKKTEYPDQRPWQHVRSYVKEHGEIS